jgi:hypothetical protein
MDLSDPTRSAVPTLDGPVLAVLAAAGRPLTVGDVAAQAARGSEIGIRRTLSRLVDQGLVRATLMGRNLVHELNREHLAAGVADVLAGLRMELWRSLREELAGWDPQPLYACVFGSAARGDGDESSDVDVLLVHPLFAGERKPSRGSQGALALVAEMASDLAALQQGVILDPEPWHQQVDRLRGLVQLWTGNPLQVVDLSVLEWSDTRGPHAALLRDVKRDEIVLTPSRVGLPRLTGGAVRG